MGKDFEISEVGCAIMVTQNATPKTVRPKRAIAGLHISVHRSPVPLVDGDGDRGRFVGEIVSDIVISLRKIERGASYSIMFA
jgi:hypothetical protein